jgi:hypothetical protein
VVNSETRDWGHNLSCICIIATWIYCAIYE